MYEEFIPTLFDKNDLDIIFATYPLKEVFDRSDFESVKCEYNGCCV